MLDTPRKIQEENTPSIHQLLQALIEREVSRLKECDQCENREIHDTDPWNEAKNDTVNNLKSLKDSLK